MRTLVLLLALSPLLGCESDAYIGKVTVDRDSEHRLRLSVAVDRRELDALEAGFARDLAPALALLGVVLLAGFAVQIGAGLRPVAGIRAGIASIRAGRAAV